MYSISKNNKKNQDEKIKRRGILTTNKRIKAIKKLEKRRMISRELFEECIELLEGQYELDLYNSKVLSDMYGVEGVKLENALYAPLVKLLGIWFPGIGKGSSNEIERYCYKGAWDGVYDAGSLYDYLVSKEELRSLDVNYQFVEGKNS